MRIRLILGGLTLALLLGGPVSGIKAQENAVAAVAPWLVPQLDTWSRTQITFTRRPIAGRMQTASSRDLRSAVEHNRPHAMAAAGGFYAYAEGMGAHESQTFKGFTYEHSVIRRFNSRRHDTYMKPGEPGHPFIDAYEMDRATDKVVRTHQFYGGANPRAALKKFLLSDRAADRLRVPKDVFQRIRQAVNESEALWSRLKSGEMDRQTADRQISQRAAKVGLKFDRESGALYMEDAKYGRGEFGRVGTGQLARRMRKLISDSSYTSNQVSQSQTGAFQLVAWRQALPGPGGAGLARSIHRAELTGVGENAIRETLKDAFQRSGSLEDGAINARQSLNRLSKEASGKQLARGGAILAAFTLAGAVVDFLASGQDIEAWVKSDKLAEWTARGASGGLALLVAYAMERQTLENAVTGVGKGAGKELARGGLKVLARRFLRVGVASAIFLVGEGVFAAVRGEGGPEIAGQLFETALVLALAEGAVIGTVELLGGAAALGSWAGPVGIGVTIGVTALYQGGKYLWTTKSNLDGTVGVFGAKCEAARDKVTTWHERTLRSIAESASR